MSGEWRVAKEKMAGRRKEKEGKNLVRVTDPEKFMFSLLW